MIRHELTVARRTMTSSGLLVTQYTIGIFEVHRADGTLVLDDGLT